MKHYYKIEECHKDTFELFQKDKFRGYYIGFPELHRVFSVIPGSTLYLYARPYAWKTWFKYEMLINLSKFYGWKHAVCDPETGSKEDIIAYLTEMVTQKDYHSTYSNKMTEGDRMSAEAWLNEHFYIIDTEIEDMTLKGFYSQCDLIEQELGIRLNTTSIDPWDDIAHDGAEFDAEPGTQAYTTSALRYVRKQAKTKNWYNIIVTHVRNQAKVKSGDTYYTPPPLPSEIAHGEAWSRKGMAMLGMWKCPQGLNLEGYEYERNQVKILPQKLKPKGVGEQDADHDPIDFYVDFKRHRFYQKSGTMTTYATPPEQVKTNNPETDKQEPLVKESQDAFADMNPHNTFLDESEETDLPW